MFEIIKMKDIFSAIIYFLYYCCEKGDNSDEIHPLHAIVIEARQRFAF